MRLNALGSATTGYATVGINGATPAALVGVFAGSRYGPGWRSNTVIVYQSGGSGTGPWILDSYSTVTGLVTNIDAVGLNNVGAGNGIYAAWLSGTGVRTNNGAGPFPAGALGDVSPDFGELVLIDTYPAVLGLTVYSAAGVAIYTDPTCFLTNADVLRIRGHVLAYENRGLWTLVNVLGTSLAYVLRINEPINWVTPIVLSTGEVLLLERSNRLTLRYANRGIGWEIRPLGSLTFNPDVIELTPGVVRIGWCTNSGESPDSLVIADLTLASGAFTISTVVGAVLVPVAQPTLAQMTFQVGPSTGGVGGYSTVASKIPLRDPVVDRAGLITKPWSIWLTQMNQGVSSASAAINALPPPTTSAGFGTVAGDTGQVPIVASSPNDTVSLLGAGLKILLDPANKTATFSEGGETTTVAVGTQADIDFGDAATLRCNNAALLSIGGLVPGVAGQRLLILRLNAAVTVKHNAGTPASAGLLMFSGADVSLAAGELMLVEYDATTARWREVARTGVVTRVSTGTYTTGGPITTTGTIEFATGAIGIVEAAQHALCGGI